jgi:hypothetical protein
MSGAAVQLDLYCMSSLLFKRIASALVVLAVCLPVTVAFAAAPAAPSTAGLGEQSARPVLGNSQDDSALLAAHNIAPGDSRSETVTITNKGRTPAAFELSKAGLWEKPGQGGGRLSTKLELRIDDVTGQRSPAAVYRGTVGTMSRLPLGSFAAGESRTYRFTATFPDGGVPSSGTPGDNAYMGASLTVDFHWTASR